MFRSFLKERIVFGPMSVRFFFEPSKNLTNVMGYKERMKGRMKGILRKKGTKERQHKVGKKERRRKKTIMC